jgi:catechol 2,3-dioxygenase-like lactoylglutathione lyase family enzyme
MILGLSHVGLTVSDLDKSIQFYQKAFGFTVLSDAERKGEWVEKISGIPGLHTRTVYLAATLHCHLEVFRFYYPPSLPPEKDVNERVGISCCVLREECSPRNLARGNTPKKQKKINQSQVENEHIHQKYRMGFVLTPDGVLFKIINPQKKEHGSPKKPTKEILYPACLVENLEQSLDFFQERLGMEIKEEGSDSRIDLIEQKDRGSVRWVLLKGKGGICLELWQPLNHRILPATTWEMQRVGFTHIAFGVKNLEGFYSQLMNRNINFKSIPQSIKIGPHQGGKTVYLASPEGIVLEFIDSPLIQEGLKTTAC